MRQQPAPSRSVHDRPVIPLDSAARAGELPLHPLDPSWILDGAPVARCLTLSESADAQLSTGVWECTAGRFRYSYSVDEIAYIVEGSVVLSDLGGGNPRTLHPGDGAHFERGTSCEWNVPFYVRKVFVLRATRDGLLSRIRRRLEAWRSG